MKAGRLAGALLAGGIVLSPVGAIAGLAVVAAGGAAVAVAPGPGGYSPGNVPAAFQPWVLRAGATCPTIGPAVIAAQIDAESGYAVDAVSPVGAQGPAQFMPGTWPAWGRDDDGNGRTSPFDIGDALMAQARFMCSLLTTVQEFLRDGVITKPDRNPLDLALAAYNVGPGGPGSPRGVYGAGGIPVNGQTELYVPRIRALMVSRYGWLPGGGVPAGDGSFGSAVLAAAVRWQGTPYSWGGGDTSGPTLGVAQGAGTRGFDCSGLTLKAVYDASQGRITLPHSADLQARMGVAVTAGIGSAVDLSLLRPGDLVMFATSLGAAFDHVGVYAGNGQMFAAPQTGKLLGYSSLTGSYYAVRYWSVRRFG